MPLYVPFRYPAYTIICLVYTLCITWIYHVYTVSLYIHIYIGGLGRAQTGNRLFLCRARVRMVLVVRLDSAEKVHQGIFFPSPLVLVGSSLLSLSWKTVG